MDNQHTSFRRMRSLLPRQRAALAFAALALTVGTVAGAGADTAGGGSGVTTTTKKATTSSSSTSTIFTSTTIPTTSTTKKATTTSSSSTSSTLPSTSTTLGTPGCADIQAARAAFNADIDAQVAAVNASNLSPAMKATLIAQLEAARAQGNAAFDAALAGCNNT